MIINPPLLLPSSKVWISIKRSLFLHRSASQSVGILVSWVDVSKMVIAEKSQIGGGIVVNGINLKVAKDGATASMVPQNHYEVIAGDESMEVDKPDTSKVTTSKKKRYWLKEIEKVWSQEFLRDKLLISCKIGNIGILLHFWVRLKYFDVNILINIRWSLHLLLFVYLPRVSYKRLQIKYIKLGTLLNL